MTLPEFENEFKIKYNSASFGAPDLNKYEISVFLTQAIRDLIKEELYPNYEYTERSKRGMLPLLKWKEYSSTIQEGVSSIAPATLIPVEDYYKKGMLVYELTLPSDLWFIVHEQVLFSNPKYKSIDVEVIPEDVDHINKTVKNPFKMPNKRKIHRISQGTSNIRLLTKEKIGKYKFQYIKKYSPIILSNFEDDPELLGDERIDGFNTIRSTELPVFLHDNIVDRGVILAIRSLRENNLKTQIEV